MSSTLSITGRADQDIKSQISSTDFAIDFGGGAEYNVTPKIGITLDVRYSVGVGNMANPPAAGTAVGGLGSTNITLSGFQVLAGVMFHVD
jgi:opacity protein-like surface antigen